MADEVNVGKVECNWCGEEVTFKAYIQEDQVAQFDDIAFFCSYPCIYAWREEGIEIREVNGGMI